MTEITTAATLVAAYVALTWLVSFDPDRNHEAVPLLSYIVVAWLIGASFWVGVAGLILGGVAAKPVRDVLRGV